MKYNLFQVVIMFFPMIVTAQSISSVKIGNQIWMTENLDLATFRNGDTIPELKSAGQWIRASETSQPAWCYYENDPANGVKYGKLYNWYAVSDSRGLCPKGWHVPSNEEWKVLTDSLGQDKTHLMSTDGWGDIRTSNSSGFSGLPGGYRFYLGPFKSIGRNASWWSSSEYNTSLAWYLGLFANRGSIDKVNGLKMVGMSVRCLRD